MGKPRLILLIRHAQSEGNQNREIHQVIPDHRVKLTDDGWEQAEEAGERLRSLLRPEDTLQFFTSPYRRTRETTEGILRTLTAAEDDGTPSPFSRHSIKVYEEPRIREQDFGNFQPCSAEMSRMWQERADYGHFFYRIPNGESAADAYDRISGFNESLWRQFSEPSFPSVCVLVTHGLMTRVFLMKWYHWSVEYFEDLRNINHCEFIVMKRNEVSDKYVLETKLRTWSALKEQRLEDAMQDDQPAGQEKPPNPQRRNTLSRFLPHRPKVETSPKPTAWGGCIGGCNHHHDRFPRRALQKPEDDLTLPAPAKALHSNDQTTEPSEQEDNEIVASPTDGSLDSIQHASIDDARSTSQRKHTNQAIPTYLLRGRDAGGPATSTPHEDDSEAGDYFEVKQELSTTSKRIRKPQRKPTVEDFERWANESGMGKGVRADALGDEADVTEEDVERDIENARAYEESVRQSVY